MCSRTCVCVREGESERKRTFRCAVPDAVASRPLPATEEPSVPEPAAVLGYPRASTHRVDPVDGDLASTSSSSLIPPRSLYSNLPAIQATARWLLSACPRSITQLHRFATLSQTALPRTPCHRVCLTASRSARLRSWQAAGLLSVPN